MAKIPRLQSDSFSTATRGSATAGISPSDAAAPFAAAADAAGSLATAQMAVEAREQKKAEDALKAKKEIKDALDAHRLGTDFDMAARAAADNLKLSLAEDPTKFPEELRKALTPLIEKAANTAPSAEVGKTLANRTNETMESLLKEGHSWARTRITDQIKSGLSEEINRAASNARRVITPAALESFITAQEAVFRPLIQKVGDDPDKAMAAFRKAATSQWIDQLSEDEPLAALQIIDAKNGPVFDNLSDQADTLRSKAKQIYEGWTKRQEMKAVQAAYVANDEFARAFMDGTLNSATLYAKEQALEEQTRSIDAGFRLDKPVLKKLGLDPEKHSRARVREMVQEQLRTVQAIGSAWRRQTPAEVEDDPTSTASLLKANNKAIKDSTVSLEAAVKQQGDIMVAVKGGKIQPDTARALMSDLAGAVGPTVDAARDLRGVGFGVFNVDSWAWFRAPREAGIAILNDRFAGDSEDQPPAVQNAAFLTYMRAYQDATKDGVEISQAQAKKLALRSLAYATGKPIPGAD